MKISESQYVPDFHMHRGSAGVEEGPDVKPQISDAVLQVLDSLLANLLAKVRPAASVTFCVVQFSKLMALFLPQAAKL